MVALIGYVRVSKADGSQSTDLQRDALIDAHEDQASGAIRTGRNWRRV